MRIRLLGPVEVWDGDRRLPLGPAKQRATLAILALRANRSVSVEQLVEGVWGEEPPASAPKLVQQHVSRLRRLLADGGTQIVTRGRGYELVVSAEAVDAL